MKILTYLPHGEIPDSRGFAPALVAQNLAARLKNVEHLHVCGAERLPTGRDSLKPWGDIVRVREGQLYRRLFRKLTRLDPYPLHRRLARIARKFRPEIIHIHQLEFPVDDFRKALGVPVKIVIHGHTIRQFDPRLGVADLYLAASGHIADGLVSGGFPEEKVQLLYNGLDPEIFKPCADAERISLRSEMGIPADIQVLIFFGRKQEVKGFDLYLKALDTLVNVQNRRILALAVGATPANASDDASYNECIELKSQLSRQGVLREVGAMRQEELARLLRVADIAVLPSREEPQGMAMIEAMAAGLIVVSSNVGGIKESITHNRDGLLIDPHAEANEVTVTLSHILDAPENYQHLKTAAAQTARDRFSWDHLAIKLQDIYAGLLR